MNDKLNISSNLLTSTILIIILIASVATWYTVYTDRKPTLSVEEKFNFTLKTILSDHKLSHSNLLCN